MGNHMNMELLELARWSNPHNTHCCNVVMELPMANNKLEQVLVVQRMVRYKLEREQVLEWMRDWQG